MNDDLQNMLEFKIKTDLKHEILEKIHVDQHQNDRFGNLRQVGMSLQNGNLWNLGISGREEQRVRIIMKC